MHDVYFFVDEIGEDDELRCVALGDDGCEVGGAYGRNYEWLIHNTRSSNAIHIDRHFGAGNWKAVHVRDPLEHPGVLRALSLCYAMKSAVTKRRELLEVLG